VKVRTRGPKTGNRSLDGVKATLTDESDWFSHHRFRQVVSPLRGATASPPCRSWDANGPDRSASLSLLYPIEPGSASGGLPPVQMPLVGARAAALPLWVGAAT